MRTKLTVIIDNTGTEGLPGEWGLSIRETTAPNCYSKKFFIRRYIGIPKTLLTNYADRIEIVTGDYKLCEGAWLIPHKTAGLEKIGKRERMYQRTARGWKPDDFSHEQSLVLDTEVYSGYSFSFNNSTNPL